MVKAIYMTDSQECGIRPERKQSKMSEPIPGTDVVSLKSSE